MAQAPKKEKDAPKKAPNSEERFSGDSSAMLFRNPQFREFASSIDYGIITCGKEGICIDHNKAVLDIFGYDETDELRGKLITDLMPERYRELHRAGMARYERTKVPRNLGKVLQLYGLTKAGKEFPLEISLSSWKDADGEHYFTASCRRYSKLERNLKVILYSVGAVILAGLAGLVWLLVRTF